MPQRAIFSISDLHLGRGNRQDSFTTDQARVRQFADALASGARSGTQVTLVINGDVFDLWELVPDPQLAIDAPAYQFITDGLLVPTANGRDLELLTANLAEQLAWALDAHREFVAMLRTLLEAGVHLVCTVGNHDHQLDNLRCADVLRRGLVERGVPATPDRFEMGRYYLDLDLGFYAEHGDQFADANSRSPLLPPDGVGLDEAAGFHFLRYVWNRLEAAGYGGLQDASLLEILGHVLVSLILHRQGPVPLFKTCAGQYFRAVRRGRAKLVDAWYVRLLYRLWGERMAARVAALSLQEGAGEPLVELTDADLDVVAEEARQRPAGPGGPVGPLLAEEEGFDQVAAAPEEAPPVGWLPGLPIEPRPAELDGYVKGLRKRFAEASGPFPQLDRTAIHTVTLGHTHRKRQLQLFGAGGPTYFNSGCWLQGKEMTYVWSFLDAGKVTSGMRKL